MQVEKTHHGKHALPGDRPRLSQAWRACVLSSRRSQTLVGEVQAAVQVRRTAVTSLALSGLAVGIALLSISSVAGKRPILVWNGSASAPIGLYLVIRQPPRLADHVLVRLPPRLAA